ncbi:hypothetical protein [Leptospira andrefontaineae]|uniref:Uncharacterized protein n=1 Tax=Leptospira andrefontaineae TaxID=2484976 RepID=A0A4R9H142_9LEPT|nr:hypothetical protein [Leptospira andrefontaineae]TGK38046.1 hypothetical protein EHO65_16215 [Leptospira andrefontaineae]
MKRIGLGVKIRNPFLRVISIASLILIFSGICITILITLLVYILPTVKEGSILYKPDLILSWIVYVGLFYGYMMYRVSDGEKAEILKMFVSTIVSWVLILILLGQFVKLEFKDGSYYIRTVYSERIVPAAVDSKLVISEKMGGRSNRTYLILDLEFPNPKDNLNIKIFTSSFFRDVRDTCVEEKKLLESAGIRVRTFCTPKD